MTDATPRETLDLNATSLGLIADTEMVFVDEHRAIVLATAPSLSPQKELVRNTTYAEKNPSAFGVSPDHKFVFLAHESFKVSCSSGLGRGCEHLHFRIARPQVT